MEVFDVDKKARGVLNGHAPCIVWLTGLSAAGKSTIAVLLERRLHDLGLHTYLMDGDVVRRGLTSDLGFSAADRAENIRRISEAARLMTDAGLIVLVAAISPFRANRKRARELVDPGEFCEVFVDTPLAVTERRDPKGLYRRARSGDLPELTGIDSPYEPPLAPEVRVDTTSTSPEQAVGLILRCLHNMEIVSR